MKKKVRPPEIASFYGGEDWMRKIWKPYKKKLNKKEGRGAVSARLRILVERDLKK